MSRKLKHVITKEEGEKEGEEEVIVHGIYKPLGRSTRRVRPDLPPAFCVLLLWASPSLTELWSHQPLLSPRKPANTKGNTLDEASGKKRAGRDGNPWLPSLRLRGEPCLSPGYGWALASCLVPFLPWTFPSINHPHTDHALQMGPWSARSCHATFIAHLPEKWQLLTEILILLRGSEGATREKLLLIYCSEFIFLKI